MTSRKVTAKDGAATIAMLDREKQGTGYVTEMRRCTGSERFGIEPHEAPVSTFPVQPSRKDGLGTMCKEHWSAYVQGLREARLAARTCDESTGAHCGGGRRRIAAFSLARGPRGASQQQPASWPRRYIWLGATRLVTPVA